MPEFDFLIGCAAVSPKVPMAITRTSTWQGQYSLLITPRLIMFSLVSTEILYTGSPEIRLYMLLIAWHVLTDWVL